MDQVADTNNPVDGIASNQTDFINSFLNGGGGNTSTTAPQKEKVIANNPEEVKAPAPEAPLKDKVAVEQTSETKANNLAPKQDMEPKAAPSNQSELTELKTVFQKQVEGLPELPQKQQVPKPKTELPPIQVTTNNNSLHKQPTITANESLNQDVIRQQAMQQELYRKQSIQQKQQIQQSQQSVQNQVRPQQAPPLQQQQQPQPVRPQLTQRQQPAATPPHQQTNELRQPQKQQEQVSQQQQQSQPVQPQQPRTLNENLARMQKQMDQKPSVGDHAVSIEHDLSEDTAAVDQYWKTRPLKVHPLRQSSSASRYKVPRLKSQKPPAVRRRVDTGHQFSDNTKALLGEHKDLLKAPDRDEFLALTRPKELSLNQMATDDYLYGNATPNDSQDPNEYQEPDVENILHQVEYYDSDFNDGVAPSTSQGRQVSTQLLEEVNPQQPVVEPSNQFKTNINAFRAIHNNPEGDIGRKHLQAQKIIEKRKLNGLNSGFELQNPSFDRQYEGPIEVNHEAVGSLVKENFENIARSSNSTNQSNLASVYQEKIPTAMLDRMAVPHDHNRAGDLPTQEPAKEVTASRLDDIDLPATESVDHDNEMSSAEILNQLLDVQDEQHAADAPKVDLASEIEPEKLKVSKHIMNEVKHDKMRLAEQGETNYEISKRRTSRYLTIIGSIIVISLIGFGLVLVGLNFF